MRAEAALRKWLAAQGVKTSARGKILCELVECELCVDYAYQNVPTRIERLVRATGAVA